MSMRIYHNPRCRKSREGVELLENAGCEFEIVEYLKDLPTKEELSEIVNQLGINAVDLIRKNEAAFKENFKGKNLSDDQWIDAMLEYPKLIQRQILVANGKAELGRPPENFLKLLPKK